MDRCKAKKFWRARGESIGPFLCSSFASGGIRQFNASLTEGLLDFR
jgi:hypothetical protein